VYKITIPSAKNDVYRTGRFHFGSAHRPVDGVDICRELYDHAGSSAFLPDDPFFSMRSPSGVRQVRTYAVKKSAPACLSYQVVGVNEYDPAMDYLRTPGVLSIADVELLHTHVTQSVSNSNTCGDVDSAGFKDGVTCDAEADDEEEEEHRAC